MMPARQNNNIATLEGTLNNDAMRRKFQEVLDKGAGAFVTSLLSLVKTTPQLANAEPKTVLSAAMTAATLKLPINPNLGFAYIIPYGNQAQFQMGWRGYVQLAMRTGQYKTINAACVYEGQVEDVDFITGEIVRGKKKSNKIVGYCAYFGLVNGFSKTLYMTREEIEEHAKTFSKSYKHNGGVWQTNFDAMAQKTVLKQLISKYGIMSIDMQGGEAMATALNADQAVIGEDGAPQYVDNQPALAQQPPKESFDAAVAEAAHQGIPAPEEPDDGPEF